MTSGGRADDAVYELSQPQAARAAAVLTLFAAAVAAAPNLEDLSTAALVLLGTGGAAFVLFAFGGGAWVFDAPDRAEAAERARWCAVWASAALCLIYLVYAAQVMDPDIGGRPAGRLCLAGLLGSWLCWCDWPWGLLGGALKRLLPAPRGPAQYRLDAAAAPKPGPAASPEPLPPGVEALLVAAGSFKVDRPRMLEMLGRYQLEDPSKFILPWLRLAVASGAKLIELRGEGPVLELRFDGRPLDPKLLEDPYQSFTADGEEAARHRHLAYGLLGLYRLEPGSVSAASGEGEKRARLLARPEGSSCPEEDGLEGPVTVIRARWSPLAGRLRVGEALARAREGFGLSGARLLVDGKEAPPPWSDYSGKPHVFERGTTRGAVLPGLEDRYGRVVRVYSLGALVCELNIAASQRSLVFVADDALSLSLSQGGVVEDEAYKRMLETVEKEASAVPEDQRPAELLRRFAYTKSGLFSALGGAAAAWGGFLWAVERRPDLAFLAGGAYALVTAAMLGFCAVWFRRRLAGLRNPFRG